MSSRLSRFLHGPGVVVCSLLFALSPLRLQAACSVQTSGINFGNYDVFAPSPTDSTGEISVDCDTSSTYTIELGPGQGSITQREMVSGNSHVLLYNPYTDASYSVVWGDGTAGTGTVGGNSDGLQPNQHTVYGRIPELQNAHVDVYSDNIVVTISF